MGIFDDVNKKVEDALHAFPHAEPDPKDTGIPPKTDPYDDEDARGEADRGGDEDRDGDDLDPEDREARDEEVLEPQADPRGRPENPGTGERGERASGDI